MQMSTASMISTGLHVAVLVFATLSFSGKAFDVTPAESLPVDIISDKQFSDITKGIKDAPKPIEKPQPLVEKQADVVKPVEDTKPKITEKAEVKPAAEKQPDPPAKAEPKPAEVKAAEKPPEPKPDPIAKKLEQPPEKQEAAVTPPPLPPKKPPMRAPPKQPQFDPDKIAALIDRRDPSRLAATGETLNPNAGLGRTDGKAAQLSQSELDALRRRITQCWTPPVGADSAQDLTVVFRVIFNQDGSVRRGPDVVEGAASSYGPIFAESARRAILQCQPYTMLRRETYNLWKDMEIGFRPSDMFQ